ncbi:Threonyl-tRNA synthetase [Parvularcula bermudensis HTCC2503]|uniref:Threonine--tRNA ligase n=1 Tax=Parvularcula bermudensis (strain ATCC BAA-594 / HTCC2503 / KCTC 12087) TaxID=314260 RepID=E0TBM2_PARBH|nr:threonine--tRNA ligase [Parvularcula bermudensis]ADM08397.1 Threonyl-tRNA synthetase [Parvularcula bermudensis HTCC2503]
MPTITLPDGAVRTYDAPLTGAELAGDISKSLAKKALAVKVNGTVVDLWDPIKSDAAVEIVTRDSEEGLDLIRHDAAHLLAQAVQALFPDTQVTIGPVIEDGFFYDFARKTPFSTEDFDAIERKMAALVDADLETRKEVVSREEAARLFEAQGEHYKAEIVRDLPTDEEVKIYHHGDWYDLCRGPHLPSTKHIGKAFKLLKLAGAYWRGDHRNEVLHRIYGTAWANEKALKAYLTRLEEAEKRDHRRLGKQMDLFHLQEEAHGSVFWHPKGYTMWLALEAYIRRRLDAAGYKEVKTPQLIDAKLWQSSGHWGKYSQNMFVVPDEVPDVEGEGPVIDPEAKLMAVKPMNCPAHVQIFRQGITSYRDLPIRMAEFGCCHRNEPHGALHGIMRVRQFTQDDAHIFCTEEQIVEETIRFCELASSVYRDLGFEDVRVAMATRPEQRIGTDEFWDKMESALEEALIAAGLEFEVLPGEGAFYAPKLEYHLRDAIGRSWQCGTLQLDALLPERLDAVYIDEDGAKKRPIMLHRAILGSMERFLGILIENHAGRMPLWLAPTQIVVATITTDVNAFAEEAADAFRAANLRVETDLRNEKINYKVREHSDGKVPIIAVIGAREAEERTLSVRRLGSKQSQTLSLDEAVAVFAAEALPPDLRDRADS